MSQWIVVRMGSVIAALAAVGCGAAAGAGGGGATADLGSDTTETAHECAATTDCDDADACTNDSCLSGKCIHTPKTCDDGDACTVDKCIDGGACKNLAQKCDDGNPCTDDTCDQLTGCKQPPQPGAKCGTGTCDAAGKCQGCEPKCVAGSCEDGCGGVCAGTCDDGDACTTTDTCVANGGCQGAALSCDDGNQCTKDTCDKATGCQYASFVAPTCSDDDFCTQNDKCVDGGCVGTPNSCDDKNECTADICDKASGCKYLPLDAGSCANGKCINGSCCAPSCAAGGAQCGDDGCGGSCGNCGATSACVQGLCQLAAQPTIEAVTLGGLFPVSGDLVLPGYIAHLFGTSINGAVEHLATVTIKNPTNSPASLGLTLTVQNFAPPYSGQYDLQAGETKTIPVDPSLDLAAINALSTAQATNVTVSLTLGGQVVDQYVTPKPIKVTTKNTVFWGLQDPVTGKVTNLRPFVTVMATPKNLAVQTLLTAAGKHSSFGAMAGYGLHGASKTFKPVVVTAAALHESKVTYLEGTTVTVNVTSANLTAKMCFYALFDPKSQPLMSGLVGPFTNKVIVNATGSYHHVVSCPSADPEYVTIERTLGENEIARDQTAAIYSALADKGMIYTTVATDFFADSQNIKTPAESLVTNSANCIDGTLVFASALEAIGMHPHLILLPHHAFVAVENFVGAGIEDWTFVETTLVSAGDPVTALENGFKEFWDAFQKNEIFQIDVVAARKLGIVPGDY